MLTFAGQLEAQVIRVSKVGVASKGLRHGYYVPVRAVCVCVMTLSLWLDIDRSKQDVQIMVTKPARPN